MPFKPLPIGVDDFEDTGDAKKNCKNAELFRGLAIMEAGEAYTAAMWQLRNAWWGLGKLYHRKRLCVSHDRKADMRTSVCSSIPIYRQDVHGRTSLAPSQYFCAWESGRGRGG